MPTTLTPSGTALPDAFTISGPVRTYAWGSTTAIADLLGYPPAGGPEAELWLGAHPDAPAVHDASGQLLTDLIAADPEGLLGERALTEFGPRLPFLLKVLAADQPLSLQVHPSIEQAQAGYAAEEGRGVPIAAAHRSYRDRGHKPELICALTDFDALCGFRDERATLDLLAALDVAELDPYRRMLADHDGLGRAVPALLRLPVAEQACLAAAVAAGCVRLACEVGPWQAVAAWGVELAEAYPGDIGSVLALLLNLVQLRPGQAVYMAAGQVHAYLRGTGVEIMASSDNVLRCGLTPKHVDVDELLHVASFQSSDVTVMTAPGGTGWDTFRTPAPDFALATATVSGTPLGTHTAGPQILLCTSGSTIVQTPDGTIPLPRGAACYLRPGAAAVLAGDGTVFRGTVGSSLTGTAPAA